MEFSTQFTDKMEAKKDLMENCMKMHKPFMIYKSSKSRLMARCKAPSCNFKRYYYQTKTGAFHLKTHTSHTCMFLKGISKTEWTASALRRTASNVANLKPADGIQIIRAEHGHQIEYFSAWRGLKQLKNEKVGDERMSYGLIRPFLLWHQQFNSNTHINVSVANECFQSCFLCPGICSNAFEYCLPILSLDACHSVASDCVFLLASSLSGADKMVPIAIGIAPAENEKYWREFILNLKQALKLDIPRDIVVFSDREKGLLNAVEELLPECSHAFCVFHIEKNVKVKFKTDSSKVLWKLSKCFSKELFAEILLSIRDASVELYQYLEKIPPEKWARSHFPKARYGHVTSNLAESANSWLQSVRSKIIFYALIEYVQLVSEHFVSKRSDIVKCSWVVPPKILRTIQDNLEAGRFLRVVKCTGNSKYQVQDKLNCSTLRIVDLDKKYCTCVKASEYGFPCVHVCAICISYNLDPVDYCVALRKIDTIANIYAGNIEMCDVSLLENDFLKPPTVLKRRGRPRIKRIRPNAEKNPGSIVCSNCGEKSGHNKRTCTAKTK